MGAIANWKNSFSLFRESAVEVTILIRLYQSRERFNNVSYTSVKMNSLVRQKKNWLTMSFSEKVRI